MQHAQERVSSLLAEVERPVREDTLPAPAKRDVLTAVRAAREATTAPTSREMVRSSYAGDALGLISNFFATGPGTEAFLTRVDGRDPGAVALGFLGANPHVARSFERLIGSAQRRK